MRFPAASTRYAKPAVEPQALAPAGSVVPAESVEFDEEGRRLMTSPLAAPARPVPMIMPPPRWEPPAPRLPSGAGLPQAKRPPGTKFSPVTKEAAANARAIMAQKPAPKKQTISPDDIPY
jgi:hypothetical protein